MREGLESGRVVGVSLPGANVQQRTFMRNQSALTIDTANIALKAEFGTFFPICGFAV